MPTATSESRTTPTTSPTQVAVVSGKGPHKRQFDVLCCAALCQLKGHVGWFLATATTALAPIAS